MVNISLTTETLGCRQTLDYRVWGELQTSRGNYANTGLSRVWLLPIAPVKPPVTRRF
jgi:hypothetical protein